MSAAPVHVIPGGHAPTLHSGPTRMPHGMSVVVVVVAIVLATGGATLLGGCREKGPAEKAGEKMDNAMEKLEDKLDPKGPLEKAGRKIDKTVDDAKD